MSFFSFLDTISTFPPILAYALAVLYNWLIDQILLTVFKADKEDYKRDLLGKFTWGVFIFAPVITCFIVVLKTSLEVQTGIKEYGVVLPRFDSYPIGKFVQSDYFLVATIVFAVLLGTVVATGYARRGSPKWATEKPGLLYFRAYLVDFPLTLATVYLIAVLLRDWLNFYNFAALFSLPTDLFHHDHMYGLAWSYKGLSVETTIVAVISLAPLVMYTRQKKAWVYGALSALGLACFLTYVFYLVPSYDTLISRSNTNFYQQTAEALNRLPETGVEAETPLEQLVLLNKLEIIDSSPKGIGVVFLSLTTVAALYNAALLATKVLFNADLNELIAFRIGRPIQKLL